MDFLVNELSLDGQFHDFGSFHMAVERLMTIREAIRQAGSSLYCHRKLANARVTPEAIMQQAVQTLPQARLRAWMLWLTRQGPYWEDSQIHDPASWLEVDGEIVTDTGVGEAAVCRARGLLRELVSFNPSDWLLTPIDVRWVRGEDDVQDVSVPNHWELQSVQRCLLANPVPIDSWKNLAIRAGQIYPRISFAAEAFRPLEGHPFVPGAAERIQVLLHTLNQLKGCFNDDGCRTDEGHRIYADHFTGDKAWFSDSSATEKANFRDDLTFPNPGAPGEELFCSWHGKVKTPQIRIHFSWDFRADSPVYVVYVGPKITKR